MLALLAGVFLVLGIVVFVMLIAKMKAESVVSAAITTCIFCGEFEATIPYTDNKGLMTGMEGAQFWAHLECVNDWEFERAIKGIEKGEDVFGDLVRLSRNNPLMHIQFDDDDDD